MYVLYLVDNFRSHHRALALVILILLEALVQLAFCALLPLFKFSELNVIRFKYHMSQRHSVI